MTWATFRNTFPRTDLRAGIGSADGLGEILAARGVRRALVICGRTVADGPQLQLLVRLLPDVTVKVFSGARQHGGLSGAVEGAAAFRAANAEALISVGGGSTIDSAKCVALLLAVGAADLERFRVQEHADGGSHSAQVGTTVLHVAIPTTAGSSSEVMPWAGIRDEGRRQKMLFHDPSLVPDVAVLDPRFVAPTNPALTSTSAVTSVARSIETIYSTSRQPIAESLALTSLRLMLRALPAVVADGFDLAARAETQIAASLSGIAAENSMVSLVHAIGHAVGGRLALQHGVAHGIMLPSVAAVCLPTLDPGTLAQVASALGVEPAGRTAEELTAGCVAALRALFASLPLPRRLRDVGMPEAEIDEVTDHTLRDPMFAYTPVPVGRDALRGLLQAAW